MYRAMETMLPSKEGCKNCISRKKTNNRCGSAEGGVAQSSKRKHSLQRRSDGGLAAYAVRKAYVPGSSSCCCWLTVGQLPVLRP